MVDKFVKVFVLNKGQLLRHFAGVNVHALHAGNQVVFLRLSRQGSLSCHVVTGTAGGRRREGMGFDHDHR